MAIVRSCVAVHAIGLTAVIVIILTKFEDGFEILHQG